jgi:RecA/RadA recombinase
MGKVKERPSISDLVEKLTVREVEYLPSGCLPFDLLNGGRGLPLDSFSMMWAPKGYGKTTLYMSLCRSLALRGHRSVFAYSEDSRDLAKSMGLFGDDFKDKFTMLPALTFKDLEDITWAFLKPDSGYTLLVVDSLTAVINSKMKEDGFSVEDHQVALAAGPRTNYLKLFQVMIQGTGKAILVVCQARSNFDKGWGMGPDFVSDGGNTVEQMVHAVYEFRGDSKVNDIVTGDDKHVVGKQGWLWSEKNRFAVPFTKVPIQVLFGKGASNLYTLQQYCEWAGYTKGSGAWFECVLPDGSDAAKVQGKAGRFGWVRDNQKVLTDDFYLHSKEFFEYLNNGGGDKLK